MKKLIVVLVSLTFLASCAEDTPREKLQNGLEEIQEGIEDGAEELEEAVEESSDRAEDKASGTKEKIKDLFRKND